MKKEPVEIIRATFVDLSFKGLGVAKVDGIPVFVEGVLPGEIADIKIFKREARYAFGSLVSLIKTSKDRVEVKERHQALTSALPLQHLSYEAQLLYKDKVVQDAFSKVEGLKDLAIESVIPSTLVWHYRNRISVAVRGVDKKLETGIFGVRQKQLTPMTNFKMNIEGIDEAVEAIRDILIEFNEKPYDDRTHTGNIRQVIVRKGQNTQEMMVIIVTRSKSLFPTSKIVPAILERVEGVVSIVHAVNNVRSVDILNDGWTVLHGTPFYHESFLGQAVEVPVQGFVHANTAQAEAMYQAILTALDLKGTESILELYSGVGGFTMQLAQQAHRVHGIEAMAEAVSAAEHTVASLGYDHVTFKAGRVEASLDSLPLNPDIIVMDPPRKGIETSALADIMDLNAQTLVYMSSNPTTLVRDLEPLVARGYQVTYVQPFDFYPHTVQVQTVAILKKQ